MSEHPESQVRADNEVFLRRRIEELEAEVKRLQNALEEIGEAADHGIPFYAYGDNEAGCEFSTRLKLICSQADNALRWEEEK